MALRVCLITLISLNYQCRGVESVKAQGLDFSFEFPPDPDFQVLRLDLGGVSGLVRIFGDGRVAVLEHRDRGGWEELESYLTETELITLLKAVGQRAAALFDHEGDREPEPRGLSRNPLRSGQPVYAYVELQLARFTGPAGDTHKDFSKRLMVGEWSPTQRYRVPPQFEGLQAVAQRLYDLTERSDLRRVESGRLVPKSLPAWSVLQAGSPKSPKILYIEQTARGRQISTMGWMGGARRRLAPVEGGCLPYSDSPAFSPNGREVLSRCRGGLGLVDLTTGASRKFVADSRDSHRAVWSPSGDSVAFSGTIADRRYHVFVAAPDGSDPKLLTDTGAWPLQWTADGESIYYRAWEGRGRRDVYLSSRHGSGKRRALSFPADFIRVSPDEKWVAIVAEGIPLRKPWPEYSFWTTRLDRSTGVVRKQAARHGVLPWVGDIDWSPDSRWLVFSLGRRIAVVRANGRGMKTLIEESVGDRDLMQPNWSPNGQAIVFVKRPKAVGWLPRDRPEIWIMGSDGSDPRRIGYGVFPHWTSESTLPLWKTDLAY